MAKGGAVLLEGRHIDKECMRSQGQIRKAGGGGGGGGAVRFRPDTKNGGGGGTACRTMIYILVCVRARDSAWGMERGRGGGGRQLVPEGGISYEWGGRPYGKRYVTKINHDVTLPYSMT